ncbi:hypothetical protein [Streptomyces sp. NPDC096323]|uniref:hypothetical protein n=1 Tax=Streptomyces sp. NPDC096323 TaxID=3155822 RepID=UPI003325B77F
MATDVENTPDAPRTAPLAPLPDHRDVNTPWWQELWRRHAHITTPMRQRGLTCDIEFGLSAYIVRVSLPDDSYLIVSPPQEPPSDRPPGDPEGWIVTRERTSERSTLFERIYDSAPPAYPSRTPQPEARHGGSAEPLIAAIDKHLDQLGLLPNSVPSTAERNVLAATPTLNAHGATDTPATVGHTSVHAYGDALLALTDRLNRTETHADAAALLHQVLEPVDGLIDRLGEFFEAAAEKAKETEDDDGFDLSDDLAEAAAEVRNLTELLDTAEARMRTLTPLAPAPQFRSAPTRAPSLTPRSLPTAPPRHTR